MKHIPIFSSFSACFFLLVPRSLCHLSRNPSHSRKWKSRSRSLNRKRQ